MRLLWQWAGKGALQPSPVGEQDPGSGKALTWTLIAKLSVSSCSQCPGPDVAFLVVLRGSHFSF